MGNDHVNAIVHGQSAQDTAALDGPGADAVLLVDAAAPAAGAAVNGTHGTANGADAVTDAHTDPVAVTATAPVGEDASANLDGDGEPSDKVARPTDVTETLAASALVPDVRPAASAWDADRLVTEI